MVKLHIAIIHGIGKNGPGFSRDLTERIRREFKRALQKILKISDDHSGDLNFIEVIWDDILAVNQARLADIFRKEFKRRDQSEKMNFASWVLMVFVVAAVSSFIFKNPWIVALIAFGAFPFVKSVFVKLRTDIAAEFIDDIICYREKVAQKMILDRVEERLRRKRPLYLSQLGDCYRFGLCVGGAKAGEFFESKNEGRKFFYHGFTVAAVFVAVWRAGVVQQALCHPG
jgi:hypothetical protein